MGELREREMAFDVKIDEQKGVLAAQKKEITRLNSALEEREERLHNLEQQMELQQVGNLCRSSPVSVAAAIETARCICTC